MPTVTITIQDVPDSDDEVNFGVVFDPPLEDDSIITAAQSEAAFIIEVMQRRASGQNLSQMADEMDDEEFGTIEPVDPPVVESN
jgi:hypothetical protein